MAKKAVSDERDNRQQSVEKFIADWRVMQQSPKALKGGIMRA